MTDEQSEIAQPERDDIQGVTIALLRALLGGDDEGMDLVMDGVDAREVLGVVLGMAHAALLTLYGGPERYAAALAAWRPGIRLGDEVFNIPDPGEIRDELAKLDRARLEMVARWIAHRLAGDLD